jgi:hypothetical protein
MSSSSTYSSRFSKFRTFKFRPIRYTTLATSKVSHIYIQPLKKGGAKITITLKKVVPKFTTFTTFKKVVPKLQ